MSSIGVEDPRILFDPVTYDCTIAKTDLRDASRHRAESALILIEITADWLTVILAVNGMEVLIRLCSLFHGLIHAQSISSAPAFALATLVVFLLDREGAYRSGSSLLGIRETERSLRVSFQACLFIPVAAFMVNDPGAQFLFLLAMASFPLLRAIEHQAFFFAVHCIQSKGIGVQNVLIYGAGWSGHRVFSALARSPKLGLNPVVIVDDDANLVGQPVCGDGYRRSRSLYVVGGPISRDLIVRYGCEWLIVAIPSLDEEKLSRAVQVAKEMQVRFALLPRKSCIEPECAEYADIDGIFLDIAMSSNQDWGYKIAKRFIDIVVAAFLIVLLLPICAAFAILIAIDSPGTVFFRQQRVGKNGTLFEICKFRTMYSDAPRYGSSPTDSRDGRITRIGRFLRRASFDELPQFFNVLKGDMSLVGPRPEMPFIAQQYNCYQHRRLDVLPGITGLWQLSGDRSAPIHENLQYDLYYIKHKSLFMDIAILLHTPLFLMRGV